MAIVYRHIRLDKNQPFYIGIGNEKSRAYDKRSRTKQWKNIAKNGYEVEILFEDIDYEEAKKKEIEFIALYGKKSEKSGTLVNLTSGGDGTLGYKHDKKSIEKCRVAAKNQVHTLESRLKASLASKGEKNGCYGRTGEKHPMFGKPGYWKDKESVKRVKVEYEGVIYESQTALAKQLNRSKAYVTKLVKKQIVKQVN
jgi:hypothetical protein